jgi:hypothetical protein
MPIRNAEDMTLNTLRNALSEATGIPAAQIHLLRPAVEFVSKQDDAGKSIQPAPIYPAIAINYMKDAHINPNNYGETKYLPAPSGMVTEFSPLAEIELLLAVSLFTNTRKEQRDYSATIEQFFLTNSFLNLQGDVLTGEYFGLKFNKKHMVNDTAPFHVAFVVETCSRILKEVIGYPVNSIVTNIATTEADYPPVTGMVITVTDGEDILYQTP